MGLIFPIIKNSVKDKLNLIYKIQGIEKLNLMLKKYDPEYYKIVDKKNS